MQILRSFYSSYYIYHIFMCSLYSCQFHQFCHYYTAILLLTIHQIFMHSLFAYFLPIVSILSPSYCCIAHYCRSSIYVLTLSIQIISILSVLHYCNIDCYMSSIHALTLYSLCANYFNLVFAASLHCLPL